MKVEINPANKDSRIVTHTAPSGRKLEVRVSVCVDLETGKKVAASVGWHAMGQVEADDAEAYAQVILQAVAVARMLDEQNGVRS